MRIFIGIPINEIVKNQCALIQNKLAPLVLSGSFSRIDNLHMTLLFIGEMTIEQVDSLHLRLNQKLKNIPLFSLQTKGLSSFKKGNAHVLFLRIEKPERSLLDMAELVKEAAKEERLHFEDIPFVPHITLGRKIVFSSNINLERFSLESHVFEVNLVHLYVSERVNGVLQYTPLHSYNLK